MPLGRSIHCLLFLMRQSSSHLFHDRVARTALVVIDSEVHQMFGRYAGSIRLDDGREVQVQDLIGFAEEHHARW